MVLLQLNSEKASGTSQDFTTTFSSLIRTPQNDGWKVALHSATIYYSWYNITSSFGNNVIRYSKDAGSTWETDIIIPNGIYGLNDINSYLQSQLLLRGDYSGTLAEPVYDIAILPNFNTLRTVVVLQNSYQLDMTQGTLYKLLGLNPQIYTVTSQGTSKVDINKGVDRVNIECSIVDGSYSGGISGNSIYSFTPSVPPGGAQVENPRNLVFLPINGDSFSTVRIRITDQNGNLLDLNKENTNVVLVLERRP